MEGTLSLFDWSPTPAAPVETAESNAVPAVPPVLGVGTGPTASPAPAAAARPSRTGPKIVVFDCETTGTDRVRDQVIELCVQFGLDEGAESRVWRICPQAAMSPGAQAVHGIAPEDLAGCPPFEALADEITAVFADADVIVGYNLAFDIDMLNAEYTRIGKPLIDFTAKKIVDAFRLWQQFEPRSLMHAHQRFVGSEFAAAHTASADVAATGRVLSGMLAHFGMGDTREPLDWEQIACKADPQRKETLAQRASWVGPSRHLRWENEVIILGFGKYQNAAVHELAMGPDRSFLSWVIGKDFPTHVSEICKAALEMRGEAFLAWAKDRYGQAAPTTNPPFESVTVVTTTTSVQTIDASAMDPAVMSLFDDRSSSRA